MSVKLREALIAMLDERCRQCHINDQICTQGLECHWNGKRSAVCTDEAMDKAIAALAEPQRNCDVGAAEDLRNRFWTFCRRQDCVNKCPFRNYGSASDCALEWMQMPYNESEAGK